jgi:hypothetical protein
MNQETRTAIIQATFRLANQFVSLHWKKLSLDEWAAVADDLSWPETPVEGVVFSLSRIRYSLAHGITATTVFQSNQLVNVYAECYSYSYSLVRPDLEKHRRELLRIRKLFKECMSRLKILLGQPLFIGNRKHPSFPTEEEMALRLGIWQIIGANLHLQIRKDDIDLPYALALVVYPD